MREILFISLTFFISIASIDAAPFLNKKYKSGTIYSYEMSSGRVIQNKMVRKSRYKVGLILDSGISNPPTTGLLYKTIYLSKAMVKKGHSYTFFICNRNYKTKEQIDAFELEGIEMHILDERLFYNVAYMERLIKKQNFDIIQYEVPQTFLDIGVKLKTKTGIASVLVLHDIQDELMSTLRRIEHNEILDFTHYTAGHLADAITTLTAIDRTKRITKHGIPKEKIFVTPIGASEELPFKGPNNKKNHWSYRQSIL